jgi:hypothetical protein
VRAHAAADFLRRRDGILGRIALGTVRRLIHQLRDRDRSLLHRDGHDLVGSRRLLAGRLRTKWIGIQIEEVGFRDTAHGFLAWAVASVLGAMLLASPASSLIGTATSGATQAAISSNQSSPVDGYVDELLRSDNPSAQTQTNPSDTRPELARLLTASFRKDGGLSSQDQQYVAKVVAARTGLSQPEAQKRVTDAVNQAKADLDRARKAAAHIAIWLTLALFIGAFSAAAAAWEGGGTRDGTWRRKV